MFTQEFLNLGRIAAEAAIETLIEKAKNETGKTVSFTEMLDLTRTDESVSKMYEELLLKGMQFMTLNGGAQ